MVTEEEVQSKKAAKKLAAKAEKEAKVSVFPPTLPLPSHFIILLQHFRKLRTKLPRRLRMRTLKLKIQAWTIHRENMVHQR